MGIFDRIAGTLEGLSGDGEGVAEAKEHIALALAFAERGDLAAAEERLAGVTARFPKLAAGFVRLGQVRARRGALDEAVAALGRAVDLDGDDAEGWFALGEVLARLARVEPARDALRRTLALAVDPALRGRAHAALGQVYAGAGQLGKATRELGKALELLGDDAEVTVAYGRTLARAGEREAAEWLTRAARRAGADPRLYVEAAAATTDGKIAEGLLREALEHAPADVAVKAALARQLAGAGRADEALALAEACAAAAPASADAQAALRLAYAAAGRWTDALEAARREAEAGAPPPFDQQVTLALGAADRQALAALVQRAQTNVGGGDSPLVRAARAFLDGAAGEGELVTLAALAPDQGARRFVAGALAPPPPPERNLVALLGWAHDLASRTPELAPLQIAAGRAAEAFDRPLLVAVMGEFNAGKSSFVNALCGDEVAPVGVTPTTATVNVLRHGTSKGARVVYHDGTTRELGADAVAPFLGALADDDAAAVRMVEIFHPLETLRRVEIVDTPGLNSIRAEHEKVARDFLIDADAIVWVFAVGQAAKATEKEALSLARAAGKRVLGVLNKVDRATEDEVREVVRHVQGGLGDLVEAIVPFSATRALGPRRGKKKAPDGDPGLAAVNQALETRFFAHARALKRATALAALRRFVAEARAAAGEPAATDFDARATGLSALATRLRGTLAAERVALRARIDEAYRSAAFEVRDFVRPRAWLFGEHRATPADEEFLVDLLEDGVGRAIDATRGALLAAVPPPDPAGAGAAAAAADARAAEAAEGTVAVAVERFHAYARGVIEGGAVSEFFRHELPRLRLDATAIRNALARRAPDPEQALFGPLGRELEIVFQRAAADLAAARTEAAIRRLFRELRLEHPLYALDRAVEDLATEHGGADGSGPRDR